MDKEAAIRSLAGPITSHFSRHDPAIDDLYPQFLNLFIRLRRVLMRQESWDRMEFERDQDRLNDFYGEMHFRMGGIVEEGSPRSQGEMEEYRRSVQARREEMRRQVQEQQTPAAGSRKAPRRAPFEELCSLHIRAGFTLDVADALIHVHRRDRRCRSSGSGPARRLNTGKTEWSEW
ncbi:MAG: hypothetical protein HYS14_02195 [Candidatus Rokubacteria bacterium]|nr:hypothetical protein [Candidatus Rokubacteria bacterium]